MVVLAIPRQPDVRYEVLAPRELLANLTLTQNLGRLVSSPVTLWSLPWEVQMYIVLPALFFLFRRRAQWTGLTLSDAAVIAASTLDHWIVFRCFPCFAGGVIAYQGLRGRPKRPLPPQFWPVALLAVSAFYWLWGRTGEAYQDLGGYASCLFLGMLIPLFRELPESWFTRAGHTIAKYSYGIHPRSYPRHLVRLREAGASACLASVGGAGDA